MDDKRADRIESKIDKIIDQQVEIGTILTKQEQNLLEHMRRTALAEELIETVRSELKPIQEKLHRFDGVKIAAGTIVATIGVLAALIKIIEFLNS
jgi:flagellar motor component MotA